MQSFMQRTDPVKLFWRRMLLFVLAIIVLLGMSGVWRMYEREQESAALNRESGAHLADLTKRAADLKANIANLDTDRGKEAVLRQEYGMGKSGEKMVIIVNPPPPAPAPATSTPLVEWFKSWWPW